MSTQLRRQFGLDIVRSAAITLVLISHFIKKFESIGIWGVELFFALSGFLIGGILWRTFSRVEGFSLRLLFNFWSRRWWRTLPNYYLFMLIFLLWHHISHYPLPSISIIIKHLWFGQDFFHPYWSWFSVSWSLCVEEWFYLSFPVILYFYSRFITNPSHSFLLTIFTVFAVCFSVRYHFSTYVSPSDLRTITLGRLDAIGCGVLMAYVAEKYSQVRNLTKALFWSGILLIVSPFYPLLLGDRTISINAYTLLLIPLGFSLMLPLFTRLSPLSSRYIVIPIEKISLWSYSIYLSHIPILFSIYALMSHLRSSVTMNVISKLIGLVLCVGISAFTFQYFELPITRKRPKELIVKKLHQEILTN